MRDEKNAGTGRLTWVEMVGGPLDGHKRQVDEARDPGRNIRFNELDRARAAVYRLRPGTRFYDYQGYEARPRQAPDAGEQGKE
jgi:hypothetical protein